MRFMCAIPVIIFSDWVSGRRMGVCVQVLSAGLTDFHILLPVSQSEEYLHVTRHTTPVTKSHVPG